jgi:hypothetical protein
MLRPLPCPTQRWSPALGRLGFLPWTPTSKLSQSASPIKTTNFIEASFRTTVNDIYLEAIRDVQY